MQDSDWNGRDDIGVSDDDEEGNFKTQSKRLNHHHKYMLKRGNRLLLESPKNAVSEF